MPGAVLYLVGAKSDRAEGSGGGNGGGNRAVTEEEGKKLAERWGAKGWCEVSSKTGRDVKKPFVETVGEVVKRPELLRSTARRNQGVALGGVGGEGGEGCAC